MLKLSMQWWWNTSKLVPLWYAVCIAKLVPRYNQCLDKLGDYVEKLCDTSSILYRVPHLKRNPKHMINITLTETVLKEGNVVVMFLG